MGHIERGDQGKGGLGIEDQAGISGVKGNIEPREGESRKEGIKGRGD